MLPTSALLPPTLRERKQQRRAVPSFNFPLLLSFFLLTKLLMARQQKFFSHFFFLTTMPCVPAIVFTLSTKKNAVTEGKGTEVYVDND
jgi:hypothetical protein